MSVLAALMLVLLLAASSQWLAWKLRVPAILFLLASGIAIGPVAAGWYGTPLVDPLAIFGETLFYPVTSLAVSVILFEGSMSLRFNEIKGVGGVVLKLISIGLLLTAFATALLAHLLLGFPWSMAAMLGAIASVSGPTVVVPLLRSVRPNRTIENIIRWEGMLVDPLGAVLAVTVFAAISSVDRFGAVTAVVWHMFAIAVSGVGAGMIGGAFLGIALRRHWLPDYLNNLFVLSTVVATFVALNSLFEGAGLLAVTVMGVVVGNMRHTDIDDIVHFKENLSIVLISSLFILLGANIRFAGLDDVLVPAIVLVVMLQVVVRPAVAFLCTLGSGLHWRERAMLGWLAPRGIVAASVAALFSIEVMKLSSGIDYRYYGQMLGTVTYLIIIGVVVIESITAPVLARVLKVARPEPRGFLIIGANALSRALAQTLKRYNLMVQLADINWHDVQAAREEGLHCYYGHAASEHAGWHLDLIGIGRLLGLSSNSHMNSISAIRYRHEFGKASVFVLPPPRGEYEELIRINRQFTNDLFSRNLSYYDLLALAGNTVRLETTRLSQRYNWKAYWRASRNRVIPLLAITPRQRIKIFTPDARIMPGPGWQIIALCLAEEAHNGTDSAASPAT